MLLRKSISNTKKLFQKTLQSLKSFFSTPPPPPYQRIPKTPSPYSYTTPSVGIGIDMNARTSFTNVDFTNPDDNKEKAKKRNHEKQTSPPSSSLSSSSNKQGKEGTFLKNGNFIKARRGDHCYVYNNKNNNHDHNAREGRSCLVEEKLKELEMMDISNVDHVLDIEEVLHYYSRLTCPAYLDIVDRFFMDMYAELFFGRQPVTPRSVNSKPRLVCSFRS